MTDSNYLFRSGSNSSKLLSERKCLYPLSFSQHSTSRLCTVGHSLTHRGSSLAPRPVPDRFRAVPADLLSCSWSKLTVFMLRSVVLENLRVCFKPILLLNSNLVLSDHDVKSWPSSHERDCAEVFQAIGRH